jgi:hypothetical protein
MPLPKEENRCRNEMDQVTASADDVQWILAGVREAQSTDK